MDLDTIARDLYGGPPDTFIAARKQAAAEARAAGDKDLATQVMALRKPTVAAWHVNLLVRERPDEVAVLLDLGRELRAGVSGLDGDELRVLTRRRHQLVAALVRLAGELGAERGKRLGADAEGGVRATLEATLADPDAADAVAAGTLSEVIQVSGFGFGIPTLAPAAAGAEPAPVADLAAHRERRSGSVERAEKDVAEATEAADEARAAAEQAEAGLVAADDARVAAAAKVKQAEKRLRKARKALDERAEAAGRARDANRTAQLALRDAERRVSKAQRRLDDLAD